MENCINGNHNKMSHPETSAGDGGEKPYLIHNSQKVETIQVSIDRQRDKHSVM